MARQRNTRADPATGSLDGASPHDSLLLTRREVLVVAAAATVAACAPQAAAPAKPTATPRPFALGRPANLSADGTVPATLAALIAQRMAGLAGIPSVAPGPAAASSADFVITFGAVPSGYTGVAVGASPAIVISNLRVPVDGVSANQVKGLLGGGVTDWRGVGAPYSLGVQVLALAGLPIPQGVTLAPGTETVGKADDLVHTVRSRPGSLALVPLEAADWTVRNVGVDNYFPAQGRGDAGSAALAPFTLTLGVRHNLVKQGLDTHALAAGLTSTLATATGIVDMAVVGDIMLGRTVNTIMVARNDYLYPYRQTHDELQSADLRIANLECTVTDVAPIPTDPMTFTFVSRKRAIDGLVYTGFNVLTVANNHANGPGPAAYLDMIDSLRARGIATCGGGKNLAAARQPAVVTVKGVRVAVLGYDSIVPQGPYATDTSTGIAPVDLATLPQDIAAARAQADIVLPYFHWGHEYENVPARVNQQQVARAAIDAGADMVLGNHPHWIQGIETYKGRLIIYSFGNFIFDQDWSRPTLEGMILHLYWRGTTLASVRWVPVIDENRCQPRLMSQAEAIDSFQRLWSGTDQLASRQYGPEPY
jgi:poly-gamma-glutamate capsule biosynthesis protein CapA/YwtB (metallophosphatase superfamily)